MSRPEYLNFRLSPERLHYLRQICRILGINPDERGAYSKAAEYALRATVWSMRTEQSDGKENKSEMRRRCTL